MTKEALEAAIQSANTWAGRSTIALAIGILGEYAVVPFLDEKRRWHKIAKIVFAVLVVAGIFGEYKFSSRIAQKVTELQRLSDHEVAVANQRASEANDRAASNENETARLRKAAEDERLARVELQMQLEPRGLTRQQITALGDYLSFQQSRSLVTIKVNPGDPEAFQYADKLWSAIYRGGWKAQIDADLHLLATVGLEIHVDVVGDCKGPDPIATILLQGFQQAHIVVNGTGGSCNKPNYSLSVIVGRRPLRAQHR